MCRSRPAVAQQRRQQIKSILGEEYITLIETCHHYPPSIGSKAARVGTMGVEKVTTSLSCLFQSSLICPTYPLTHLLLILHLTCVVYGPFRRVVSLGGVDGEA